MMRRSSVRALPSSCRVGLLAVLLAIAAMPGSEARGQPAETTRSAVGNYLAGRHAERLRDPATAAQLFEAALAADPGNFEILQRLHTARIAAGDFAGAVAAAARVAERSPPIPRPA